MGNLIKDFWTYEYKGGRYHGIVEVVGRDLQFRRVESKFETRIEKAIAYLEGKRMLSHMTLQSYNVYLNKAGRTSRNEDEETFYPFFLEFEPHVKPGQAGFVPEYQKAVAEAYQTVNYLQYEMNVDPEDLLIMITNSRSVYLFVNPVVYGLKPSKILHKVYQNMYQELDEAIGFKYVDTHMFRFNGLIKTPGAYYKGGFVVPVTVEELKKLSGDPEKEKYKLTRRQRSVDKNVPGAYSGAFAEMYSNSIETVRESAYKGAKKVKKQGQEDVEYLKSGIGCIDHLEMSMVEPGQRNFALVALAIAYKNAGYSEEQTLFGVKKAADRWNHDENERLIASKVKTVYAKEYNFSCSYLKEHVDLCGACKHCKLNKKARTVENTKFRVGRRVIELLQANKASLRHYKAYIVMSRNNLIGQYFEPEEYNLDPRTIREMVRMVNGERDVDNGRVKVEIDHGDKKYLLPNGFVDNGEYEVLGERLKPYLIIYTRFCYKTSERYGMMRVKVEKIARILGYKSMSSVYKLIKDLHDLGLVVFKKGYLFSLYFESYKIVSMDEYKENKELINAQEQIKMEFKTGTYDRGDTKLYWKLSRGSP